ncbi:kinase-like domain-containing protein, partial [Aspergillus caelatus]
MDLPHIDNCEEFPYGVRTYISAGRFATVWQCTRQKEVVACKLFANSYDALPDCAKYFGELRRNEVNIMGKLRGQRHIVHIIETICIRRDFFIIMTPLAEFDLQKLLSLIRDGTKERDDYRESLLKAFGCLSSALDYIHEQKIRHKDIKPQNILYSKSSCYFADFGISQEFEDHSNLLITRSERPQYTDRYCPPETLKPTVYSSIPTFSLLPRYPWLAMEESFARDARSDVFSLGCTFYEILAILEPEIFPTQNESYRECITKIKDSLKAAVSREPSLTSLLEFCSKMLSQDRIKRPHPLLTELKSMHSSDLFEKYFCHDCRLDISKL